MNDQAKLITIITAPLMLLNLFGAIVSGIWLAVLGEWGLIGIGIVAMVAAHFAIGIALLPGLLFLAPLETHIEKGNKFGAYFFLFLTHLYKFVILTSWCVSVLYLYTEQASSKSIIPILIWSYSVATNPIAYLAARDAEGGNEYAAITTFFIQMAYILSSLAILFFDVSLFGMIVLFGAIMVICVIYLLLAVQSAVQSGADH